MPTPRTTASSLFIVFLVAGSIAACSDDDRPGAAGSSGGNGVDASGIDSATTEGGGGPDAGVDPQANKTLCDPTAQLGEVVAEDGFIGNAPSPVGGTIEPGVYLLSSLVVYNGPMGQSVPTGVYGRGTIHVFATGIIRIVGSRGTDMNALPADKIEGFSYASKGTSLELTPICPQSGAVKSVPYAASGAGVSLYVDAKHIEEYVRQQ